jgi:hypothetical protein
MATYNLENNIDFYAELYKQLESDNVESNEGYCLITNAPLIDNFVELECGHKFNYEPLYNDIKNHKQKFNTMEAYSSKLKYNEIRCPYCRNKTKTLLPYYEDLGLAKIPGVNFINPNCDPEEAYKKCECNILNVQSSIETGPPKIVKCPYMGTQINYFNGQYIGTNYGDEKYYCYKHKKQIIKTYKKQILDKKKEDLKQVKLAEKQKKKEEKEATKQKKVIISENFILCDKILLTGPNKGSPCGCKAFEEKKCKRHYKKPCIKNEMIESDIIENNIIENKNNIIENNIIEKII